MKAHEFMAGDLATIHLPGGGKVTRSLDIGDLSFFVNFDPVPITPEILLKNGFVGEFIRDSGITCTYTKDMSFDTGLVTEIKDRVEVRVSPETGSVFIYKQEGLHPFIREFHGNNIKYFHELQHALRLCGIEKEIVL